MGAVSPGEYDVTFALSSTQYELIDVEPASPFSILSNQSGTLKAKLADKGVTSLLVKVTRSDTGSIISGAQVQLSNADGYSETQDTNGNGNAFFPKDATPLQNGDYHIKITAPGMADSEKDITINHNELLIEAVALNAA